MGQAGHMMKTLTEPPQGWREEMVNFGRPCLRSLEHGHAVYLLRSTLCSGGNRGIPVTVAEWLLANRCRRVQRQRAKGWKMPPNTVYVGRPSRWGNPTDTVEAFRRLVMGGMARFSVDDVRMELWGTNLACWCPLDQPCHADVLLEIANA